MDLDEYFLENVVNIGHIRDPQADICPNPAAEFLPYPVKIVFNIHILYTTAK